MFFSYLFFFSPIFSSIRMSKQLKLSGAAYHKLKATRERKERRCVASLHVFLRKKFVAEAKCKYMDAECTSKLEHGENVNIMETNIEIKVEEEFPAGINVVKEIEVDNDDVPKELSSCAYGKERY